MRHDHINRSAYRFQTAGTGCKDIGLKQQSNYDDLVKCEIKWAGVGNRENGKQVSMCVEKARRAG